MDMLGYAYNSIKRYNPYKDLAKFRYTKYFEQRFLDYLEEFRNVVVKGLKERLGHQHDEELDNFFAKVIKRRNSQEISRIIHEYSELKYAEYDFDNEEAIADLKRSIRNVKNMILISEPTDMERLQMVDKKVGEVIDEVSTHFNVTWNQYFNGIRVSELFDYFNPSTDLSLEEYSDYVYSFKKTVEDICEHYRKNYSVETATIYINELRKITDDFIRERNKKSDFMSVDEKVLDVLVSNSSLDWQMVLIRCRSINKSVTLSDYDAWVRSFREQIDKYKSEINKRYTSDVAKKMIDMVDLKTGQLIDQIANTVDYPKEHKDRLQVIFDSYKPEDLCDPEKLGIFDQVLYSSEEERSLAYCKYYPILFNSRVYFSTKQGDLAFRRNSAVSLEEASAFEMRMYEQYNRIFKGKIRKLNSDIREAYSLDYANKMVDSINRRADALIREKAKKIGMPVPKNPWFVRKYLWSDTTNFVSEEGIKFRQFINPLMREIVKLKMENKIIVEERPQLDPTRPYIFVPTHYFTEDIIGLFSSLGRQGHMLLGTTDQIENNPLMIAAVLFGFFHVDRMDTANRKECVEKQNKLIDYETSFINYVGGSWENSENELQPSSFSGPYRTSTARNVQIVPVASYLVRENNEMYVRYGDPMDLSEYDEMSANDIIRDNLAAMHFKQLHKHSVPIETIEIEGYGLTHNLPYDQHAYYMEQVANEYWKQYWSKPFAVEEIGLRSKKVTEEGDVYSFVDDLSRDKLIELSWYLSEPMLRRYERDERYNIIKYIDENYRRLKNGRARKKAKKGN